MIEWLNGDFVEAGVWIDTRERGFLLGDGAFETFLVLDGKPVFLKQHLERLRTGLAALRIDCAIAENAIRAAVAELARRNELDAGKAAARLTVTRGLGPRGLSFPDSQNVRPVQLLSLSRFVPPAPAGVLITGHRRMFSSQLSCFKFIGGYGENMLALYDANREGAGDAVLLNEHGRIACASASNVFVVTGRSSLKTPAQNEGALPGVVRAQLLSLAPALGIQVVEDKIDSAELQGAPLFLTNSLIGLRQAWLGSTRLEPPEIFFRLRTAYEESIEAEVRNGGATS